MADNQNYDKWTMWWKGKYKESIVRLNCQQDCKEPAVTDMLVLDDGRLVTTDAANCSIKVVSQSDLHTVASFSLPIMPKHLALLPDRKVVITFFTQGMVFLDIYDAVTIMCIQWTSKLYTYGIVAGPDDTLIACGQHRILPGAFVDMIRRDGTLVRTIVDADSTQLMLKSPGFMCVMGDHLLVPDCDNDCVYRVEISTGCLVDTISHDSIFGPTQAISDNTGSLFIHYMKHGRWLEYTPSAEWSPYVLKGNDDRPRYIRKICPTESGFVVLFVCDDAIFAACAVIRYEVPFNHALPQSECASTPLSDLVSHVVVSFDAKDLS